MEPMTTLILLAHASGAPHAHAESVTGIIIALTLLALGLACWKTA